MFPSLTTIAKGHFNDALTAFVASAKTDTVNAVAAELTIRLYAAVNFVPPVTPDAMFDVLKPIVTPTVPAADVIKAIKSAGFLDSLSLESGLMLAAQVKDVLAAATLAKPTPTKLVPWWVAAADAQHANEVAAAVLPSPDATPAATPVPAGNPDSIEDMDLGSADNAGLFIRDAMKAYVKHCNPAAHAKYKALKSSGAANAKAEAYAFIFGLMGKAIDASIKKHKA